MNDPQRTTYRVSDDPIIRSCAFYVLLYLGSLILGGIGVFEIVFGLMIVFTRILVRVPYFQPFVLNFWGFKKPEQIQYVSNFPILRAFTFIGYSVIFIFYGYISFFLIRMGIIELLDEGFLNQNLIYILFFK